jgi:hypothetical protein
MMTWFSVNLMDYDIRAILRKTPRSTADPTWPKSTSCPMLDVCPDEDRDHITPGTRTTSAPPAVTEDFDALLLPWANDSFALRWQDGEPAPYMPLPHPIRLHGHDDYILACGGRYTLTWSNSGFVNSTRRGTINIPQNRLSCSLSRRITRVVSWLLHCHIEWRLHDWFAMSISQGVEERHQGCV